MKKKSFKADHKVKIPKVKLMINKINQLFLAKIKRQLPKKKKRNLIQFSKINKIFRIRNSTLTCSKINCKNKLKTHNP